LLDYLVVEDVGRIVNPVMLHRQAIGGVVQGWATPSWRTWSATQTGSY
jgi:CO/xanthine dehydrogenase Mo-binding subunit